MRASLRRPPLLAFLALTAGLAGALVLLALLDAAIFRPVPGVVEPDRLVSVGDSLSYPSLADFRAVAAEPGSGLAGFAGFAHRFFAFSAGAGNEERVVGAVVAGDYFGLLGARAARGRLLGAGDDRADAPLAAVLSHALWRDRFASADDVVGREIRLNGAPFRVVGVAAPELRGLARNRRPDLWITAHAWFAHAPLNFARLSLDRRGWSWINGFARLAPGADLARAKARLVAEAERQVAAYPNDEREDFARLELAPTALRAIGVDSPAAAAKISFALGTLVALLVVLAVSSAAHLFLARGEARRQELATRLALGADRRRISALLLAEPLLASAAAVAAAIAFARAALVALGDETLPGGLRLGDLGLAVDARVAALGALLALVAGLAAGLLPARRLWRDGLAGSLATARTVSRGSTRTRRALTAAQVAISLLLLVATALATRALGRATAIDTGFDGERLGFVTLDAGLARLTAAEARAVYDRAVAAVAAVPGVEAASLVGELPLDPGASTESFRVPGYEFGEKERTAVEVNLVGAGALSLLGVELLEGREIEAQDRPGAELVGVVSASFAKRYFAGREAVGGAVDLIDRSFRIVGVVGDVETNGPGQGPQPMVYLALSQEEAGFSLEPMSVVYRASDSAPRRLASVVAAAAAAAPGVPVVPVGSYDQLLSGALAPQRFGSALFGLFSTVATVLAAVGLFGLVAHAAAARTRELGLRAALGALPSELVRLLVGSAFVPVAIGLAIGLAAAVPLVFAARGVMVGIDSLDWGALGLAAATLAAVALLAALLPAMRGARLDPVAALRTE